MARTLPLIFAIIVFTAVSVFTQKPSASAGSGKIDICLNNVLTGLRCSGEPLIWEAGVPFSVYIDNPLPITVETIGIVVYQQAEDVQEKFIIEMPQKVRVGESKVEMKNFQVRLPAGKFTIYVVEWAKREPKETTKGYLKDYLARSTVVVK